MAATGVQSTTSSRSESQGPGVPCTASTTPSAMARSRTSARDSAAATCTVGSRAFSPRASEPPMRPSPTMPTRRGSLASPATAHFPPVLGGASGSARSGRSARAPRR